MEFRRFRAPDLGPICMRSCLASPQAAAFLQTCKSERNGHLWGKDQQINLGISRKNSESKGPEMTRKSVRILELALLGLGIPSIMQMAQGAWCHRRCASSAAAARQATSPWGTMEHRALHPTLPLLLNHAIPQFNRKCSQPNALKLQMRNANPVQASSNLLQTKCK